MDGGGYFWHPFYEGTHIRVQAKPTQDELNTLVTKYTDDDSGYEPGSMRITDYTELPDDEEK